MVSVNEQLLANAFENHGIILSEEKLDRLLVYLRLLLEANTRINLTAITDYQEALFKHLFDALLPASLSWLSACRCILDVGSGPGIPGIPLAIAFPEKIVYSLEATRKKVDFQLQIKEQLKLANFFPVWDRAETLAHHPTHRGQYDVVVARALAAMPVLLELMLPFAKVHGHLILYKGKEAVQELKIAENALRILHGQLHSLHSSQIPFDYGERQLLLIEKLKETPRSYPRKPGMPQKKPLY